LEELDRFVHGLHTLLGSEGDLARQPEEPALEERTELSDVGGVILRVLPRHVVLPHDRCFET
jgi:hypothetical protein